MPDIRLVFDPGNPMTAVRHDWSRGEVEALFALPFNDLIFRAQSLHRQFHDPNQVQISTLLSIKTGGCSEDCGYCSQSARYDTGLERERLMPIDEVLENVKVITANVIVAPKLGTWEHSVFFGAALDDEGNVFATGYGRDDDNNTYRIETSRYSPEGQRTAHVFHNEQSSLAYGSDVAVDSQGRVHVAGAVTQKGVLQGYVFSRSIASGTLVFEQWFPGTGASEALGMLVNTYDRIVPAGYITTNGTTAARIVLIHG